MSDGAKTAFASGEDKGAQLIALTELAASGNRKVKNAFREAGKRLGFAVASVLTLTNPQAVILAGIVGRQSDYFAGVVDTLAEICTATGEDFPLACQRRDQ